MSGRALLLLNGELRDVAAVRAAARSADWIICADGGARHARALDVVPDAIVGDLDSLATPLPQAWGATAIVRDGDETHSDLDKALDYAIADGASAVVVAGALGGGLDHELVNLAVLEKRAGECSIEVLGGGSARLLRRGRHTLQIGNGRRFSLLAAPTATATLTGARFGLSRERLTRGSRGLGNRADGRVILTVHSGRVWVVQT